MFWIDNYKVLFEKDNILKIIPTSKMSQDEKLNAISRLAIIYMFIVFVFSMDSSNYYFSITLLVITIAIYKLSKSKPSKELFNDDTLQNNVNELHSTPNEDLQAGYIDSNNTIQYGSYLPPYPKKDQEPEPVRYRLPSENNPFMNPSLFDYNNNNPPEASNADDKDINEKVMSKFNDKLYRDVDELWDRGNSQRQFYTLPSQQVPNNQVEFGKWLYNVTRTCKEADQVDPSGVSGYGISSTGTYGSSGNCLRHEDIRFKRNYPLWSI